MLANPPYGKSWKKDLEAMGGKDGRMRDPRFKVMHRGETLSLATRSSDGQLLFLANMASKMNRERVRKARQPHREVHNGSSLFTGDAGSGESNIRRWLFENDWVEAIIALPREPLLQHRHRHLRLGALEPTKAEPRKGKVQLIDATQWFKPLRKNLGKKNCVLSDDRRAVGDGRLRRLRETASSPRSSQRGLRLPEGDRRAPAATAQPAHDEGHRIAALRVGRRGRPQRALRRVR
jgi:type I restriction enzyme M protein